MLPVLFFWRIARGSVVCKEDCRILEFAKESFVQALFHWSADRDEVGAHLFFLFLHVLACWFSDDFGEKRMGMTARM